MEKPEDYVREFERDFPEHRFTRAERERLLSIIESAQWEAVQDGLPWNEERQYL